MTLDESTWSELENYRDYLEHYGVPGMKWGVRKARETGSSTRSLKKKEKVKSRMTFLQRRKQERIQKEREKAKKKKEADAKKEAQKRQQILRSPTKLYKHRYEFSQDEVNNAIKNFKWEADLKSYSEKELDRGRSYIDTAFKYANSSINLYNTAARVVNAFDLSSTPWKYIPTGREDKKDDGKKKKKDN